VFWKKLTPKNKAPSEVHLGHLRAETMLKSKNKKQGVHPMMQTKVQNGQNSQSRGVAGTILAVSGALNNGTKIFDLIVGVSIVFIIGSTVADIVSRTWLLKTLPMVRELSLCLLIVIIWGGAVHTLRENAHVIVTIFTDKLNPKYRALLKMATSAISAFCCIFGTYSSWFMFKKALTLGMVTPVAGIPITPFKGLILFAFAILTLQFIGQGFEAFSQFRTSSQNTEEEEKEIL
jgi:TRAP-type C4-dicarboxylate transport system permease small subunit